MVTKLRVCKCRYFLTQHHFRHLLYFTTLRSEITSHISRSRCTLNYISPSLSCLWSRRKHCSFAHGTHGTLKIAGDVDGWHRSDPSPGVTRVFSPIIPGPGYWWLDWGWAVNPVKVCAEASCCFLIYLSSSIYTLCSRGGMHNKLMDNDIIFLLCLCSLAL